MLLDVAGIVLSLLVILAAAELFTNGVEWLGARLNLGAGVVGSILAAVGTALPESMVAAIGILVGTARSKEVGVGATLGAPFLLSTLAFTVTGLAVLGYSRRRRGGTRLEIDCSILKRDMRSFVAMYALALAAAFVPLHAARVAISLILVAGYALYLRANFSETGAPVVELKPLHIGRVLNSLRRSVGRRALSDDDPPPMAYILLQFSISLAIIVGAAHYFVHAAQAVALQLGFSAMLFSMIVAPIMTELPEKANSVVWVRQDKDTLALGNITGAMVFQSSMIPALGISLTPWALRGNRSALLSMGIALFNSLVLLLSSRRVKPDGEDRTTVSAWFMVGAGFLYFVWLTQLLYTR
jgi:cation:H+ antiporter